MASNIVSAAAGAMIANALNARITAAAGQNTHRSIDVRTGCCGAAGAVSMLAWSCVATASASAGPGVEDSDIPVDAASSLTRPG
ncbi:hypothetical protein GCM10010460_11940 [Microbacterium terrae]